jgi:hypothetical protein
MPIDQQGIYSNAQAITANAISDNVIDHGSNYADPGVGPRALYVEGIVTTTFSDSGNNSTGSVIFQQSPYVGINSSITNTTIGTIATNAAANTRLGPWLLPPIKGTTNRYSALYYSMAGGDFSAGAVSLWITADPRNWAAQPVNYTGPSTT